MLHREKTIEYFKEHLESLPEHYTVLDTSRLTVVYFCVVGLDILGEIESIDKQKIIDTVYAMQLSPKAKAGHQGFAGSFYGQPFGNCLCAPTSCIDCNDSNYIPITCQAKGHIALTYTALAILRTLGDDFSRIDKMSLIAELQHLRQADGSFSASTDGGECDTRFLFCACAISHMINDWSGVDKDAAVVYIKRCLSYEGGFSLTPGLI